MFMIDETFRLAYHLLLLLLIVVNRNDVIAFEHLNMTNYSIGIDLNCGELFQLLHQQSKDRIGYSLINQPLSHVLIQCLFK